MPTMQQNSRHIIRRCVYCRCDDAEVLFTYTRDFLMRARGMTEERLTARGWTPETTSSIVKCRSCGCNYVRDVFIIYEQDAQKPIDEHDRVALIAKYVQPISIEQKNYLRYCRALADLLIRRSAKGAHEKRVCSLLDFGSSLSSFSLTARVCGFDPVVLYDPYFRPAMDTVISRRHPLMFRFISNKEQLRAMAPFDVITCQAAVEHFYDPQSELRFMHELLCDDGALFITNPCEPLNKNAQLLQQEAEITRPSLKRHLQKNYHLQHINFPSPKQFSLMLSRAGFREEPAFLYYPYLDAPALGVRNIVRMGKASALYALDVLRIKHKRKTAFMAVKR